MLKRFGVSLNERLLNQFDTLLEEAGYTNRSEAIRDLIRDALVRKEWTDDETVTAGIALIVYDHHQHELAQKVTDEQHHNYGLVISSMHAHLDEHNCLEVILLQGKNREIKRLADALTSIRGIKHGRFVSTTTGKNL